MPKKNRPEKAIFDAETTRIRTFVDFAGALQPRLAFTPFHERYYGILNAFAEGKLRKLIVTIPPQHGKSQGASVLLPAWLLARDPDRRIAIASYNLGHACRFNRQIQRLIDAKTYRSLYPETALRPPGSRENYLRTAEEFEVVGRQGGVLAVGREGALTGNPVDVMIIDDLYRDALEANSPVIRDNAWEWYVSVVRTRLHNDSRELIVMTRWHEDDLVGRLIRKEKALALNDLDQLDRWNEKTWALLNFEAIKTGPLTPLDPRSMGEALWPERQNTELLFEKRALDPPTFECMYQGNPVSREGLLYGERLPTYTHLPHDTVRNASYTDTADTGDDYLCSICYRVGRDGLIYVTDAVHTPLGMEFTEEAVAGMLIRNETRVARIESNNGGRGFARNVAKLCPVVKVEPFTQSANKESRILTNAPTVLKHIRFPSDWAVRWPELYAHLTGYRRSFRSNRYHDAADVLTGIVEYEIVHKVDKRLKKVRFSG